MPFFLLLKPKSLSFFAGSTAFMGQYAEWIEINAVHEKSFWVYRNILEHKCMQCIKEKLPQGEFTHR